MTTELAANNYLGGVLALGAVLGGMIAWLILTDPATAADHSASGTPQAALSGANLQRVSSRP